MANRTIIERSGGFGIDTSDFKNVAKALRQAKGQTQKNFRRGLRAAGEIVAVEARAVASENSTKIPPSIKVRVTGATVSVIAGGQGVPTGGLFELGNAGGGKSAVASRGGTFRAPLFGNKNFWYSHAMHPFLKPAAANKEAEVERAIVGTLDEAIKTITFGS
jgi:hypothetical protein